LSGPDSPAADRVQRAELVQRAVTAHIATFTEVRDGRIYRHATYDCYEPLS
jgi:hypothetical protein